MGEKKIDWKDIERNDIRNDIRILNTQHGWKKAKENDMENWWNDGPMVHGSCDHSS